jgi:protoheme IX farnesyltransferase
VRSPTELLNGEGGPGGYLALVKPRVLFLLVFAGIASLLLASKVSVDPYVLLYTLVGGVLAVGSANIFNNLLDKDRDSLMERTMWRPLPTGRVGPQAAAALGFVLGTAGLLVMWFGLNPLTSALTLGGVLYYILVYTVLLKPRTPENITLGGVAGAFPPLVGWAAVTGTLDWTPVLIGVLIVLWTPAHFWSLALVHRDDYERAGFPMLPVVRGERETQRRIVAYTVALLAVSILLYWVSDLGLLYLVLALAFTVPVLALSVRLLRVRTVEAARLLFRFSSPYLAVLLVVMVLDRFLGL